MPQFGPPLSRTDRPQGVDGAANEARAWNRRNRPESPLSSSQRAALGVTRCGDTYASNFDLRRPVGGVDDHVARLHAITPAGQFDDRDPGIFERIRQAAADATEALGEYGDLPSGCLDAPTRELVRDRVDRALEYVDAAERLASWWGLYLPPPGRGYGQYPQFGLYRWNDESDARQVRGWPLYLSDFRSCSSGDYGDMGSARGGGRGPTWYCPSTGDKRLHDEDRERLAQLLEAAVRDARCAQEAVHAQGIYCENRRESERRKSPFPSGGSQPPPRGPGGGPATFDPTTFDPTRPPRDSGPDFDLDPTRPPPDPGEPEPELPPIETDPGEPPPTAEPSDDETPAAEPDEEPAPDEDDPPPSAALFRGTISPWAVAAGAGGLVLIAWWTTRKRRRKAA